MTEKLFWHDPYLTELETTISAVNGADIQLAETIFFVESGGQESDIGSIGGEDVLEARFVDGIPTYTLLFHDFQVGDKVTVVIDWERRYRLMKLHFAAELVLELVYQHYDRPEKIGAHIAAEKARIDFIREGNISEVFDFLKEKVTEIVNRNLLITSAFEGEAKERRYWQIDGFARVPCGGTHLKKTGEVGAISLKRKNPGQGRERIEIYLV